MANELVGSIAGEYRRYKALAQGAMDQLSEEELCADASGSGNSIAAMVWHVSGNLASRFTDFLSSDGEKSWRLRDSEFDRRQVSREELSAKWEAGWNALFKALAEIQDSDLHDTVAIRGVPLTVSEALHRSLAHTCYHVGQIVYVAKSIRKDAWRHLSIARGGSDAYRTSPGLENPLSHVASLRGKTETDSP
jgi:hypothetical protein